MHVCDLCGNPFAGAHLGIDRVNCFQGAVRRVRMHQDGEVEPVLIGDVVVQASEGDARRTAAGLQVAVVVGYEPRDVRLLIVLLNGDSDWIKAVGGIWLPGNGRPVCGSLMIPKTAGSKYPCFMASVGTVVIWVD